MAPSPFSRLPRNASQKPPQAETPVVYPEAGINFPYRGVVDHGVDPNYTTVHPDPEEADYGTTVAVPLEHDKPKPDPVAVYLVTGPNDRNVIRDWDIVREYVRAADSGPRMILGRDATRSSTYIQNTHATDTLYLAPNPTADISMMYPVKPGTTFDLGNAQTEVWAKCADGLATDGTHDIVITVKLNREVDVPRV